MAAALIAPMTYEHAQARITVHYGVRTTLGRIGRQPAVPAIRVAASG
jgi:hypothetical protein